MYDNYLDPNIAFYRFGAFVLPTLGVQVGTETLRAHARPRQGAGCGGQGSCFLFFFWGGGVILGPK